MFSQRYCLNSLAGPLKMTHLIPITPSARYPRTYQNLAILVLTLSLAACTPFSQKSLVEGRTTALPPSFSARSANGAIFQTEQARHYGYQPIFEDIRPRQVGDTLTILMQENVSASKSASSNASRDGSAQLSFDAVPHMLKGVLGHARADADMGGGSKFSGKGGAAAKNTFNGSITVTVMDVLENGNLRVIGEKQIAINQGTEFIRFSGVVNPRTISASNSVSSTQVSDARIEYVGDGYLNETQQMGWLQRLFINLSPF